MVARRRHRCLFEALEGRAYLTASPTLALAGVAADLADGTPTRIYRTPALLQNAVSTNALKVSPNNLQGAQAYFNLVFGDPPPTITSDPTASFLDNNELTAALHVDATASSSDYKLSYTWSVTTMPNGTAPTFSINGSNSSQDTAVTFYAAGDYTFQVQVSDGLQSTLGQVNVHVDSIASHLVVAPGATQGSNGTLRPNASSPFSAFLTDQFGQAFSGAVTWSLDAGSVGTVSSTGVYQAAAQSGSATVRATYGSLTAAATVTVANGAPVVVTPASTGTPSVTGTTATLNVLGNDDGGESNLVYTWTLTSGPGALQLSANGTNGAKSTTVTFSKAGVYSFLVTISDGVLTTSSAVTLTVVQKVTSIAVTPASPTVNLKGTSQFSAVASDQFGDVLTTQPTFTWTRTGVGGVNGSGLFTAGTTAGGATVTASAGGVSGSAGVTVNNAAPTIATPANGATTVTGVSTTLGVLGADDGGETGLTYTWSLASGPGSPTFTVNGTNASKTTSVNFTQAGVYSFIVTVSDGTLSTTSTVSVTVAATLSSIVVTPGSFSLAVNQTQNLSAVGYDQFGDALAVQPALTWSKGSGVGTIDSSGLYSAGGLTGVATLSASSGGVTGFATAVVGNNAPTVATAASTTTPTVTSTTAALTVLGADDGGENNLTYTWSLISSPTGGTAAFLANGTNGAKATTVTFNKAGTYTFQVTLSDGSLTTTSSVTLSVVQQITSIAVTPGTSGVNLNGSKALSAVASDQFGAVLTTQPTFSWTKTAGVGVVNSMGTFTAGTTAGSATITASAGGVNGTATVTVTNAAPTVVTPATAVSTVTGTSTNLSVLGGDDAGEPGLTYMWSLVSGPGGTSPTFSVNGSNASKSTTVSFSKAGAYSFLVTISDGTLTTSSSVTLTVVQTLTSIAVTPGSSAVNLNGTKGLSAVANDQFGTAMTAQPTFAWSKVAGVGSVNASGVYTAGITAGSATIVASASGVSGSATVTVTNSAPTVATPASGPTTVTGLSATLSALGADDAGENGLTYTWAMVSGPGGSTPTFNINGSNAAKTATVTFNKAGSYTFQVTISDGSLTTTSSVTLSVVSTLSSIAVTPGTWTVGVNGTKAFSAVGYDQFNLALSVQPTFTWSKVSGGGSVSAGGLFTAGTTAGSATIAATVGGINGTATVTVTNGAPTVATPASGPGTVTGTTGALSVLGADDGGESGLTYSWSLSSVPTGGTATFSTNGSNGAKNTVATFTKAGTYTFLVTISDGSLTTSSAVTVVVGQTVTSIGVSPGTYTLNTNAVEQFSATAYDQFGAALTVQPAFTWTVDAGGAGTITSGALFTAAGGAGSATVRATSGGLSGTAGVTVTAAQTGNPVTITTRSLTSFTELVITGTTANDTISVSQNGNTFTVVSNGVTQTVTGTFGDVAIHAGNGGSVITVGSSVTINTMVYGGAGVDQISDFAVGGYNAVVTIGGGLDAVTGNGVGTNYWVDTTDSATASTAEQSGGFVHRVGQFYQPWSTDPANAGYISTSLSGQNLLDPVDGGGPTRFANSSLFGTGPTMNDIRQGGINDCYVLADLEGLAFAGASRVQKLVVDLGDGTYAVQFNRGGVNSFVRVDGDLSAISASVSSSGGLWVPLIEKAYAYFRTGGNSYGSLGFGSTGTFAIDLGQPLQFLSPQDYQDSALYTAINNYLLSGKVVSSVTPTSIAAGAPIFGSHAYAITSVSFTGGTLLITMRNPWGFDGAGNDGNASDGLVTLTVLQLRANFSYLTVF